MKQIIYIIVVMILVNSVLGIEECLDVIVPSDVPCAIKSTWQYDQCNLTEIKVYNSTPELQWQRNFTDYGTVRCNVTWNISTVGSYFWNVSNGDSGHITVEVDEKMNIALAIVLGTFAVLLIAGGIILLIRGQSQNVRSD